MIRVARRALLLALILLGAVALAAADEAAPAAAPCAQPRLERGLGIVCERPDGLLDVYTEDGVHAGTTHGLDPVPVGEEPVSGLAVTTPACVSGAAGTYYTRVIYARAADDADGYSTWAPRIRALVANANKLVSDAGAATGGRVDLKVKCVDGVVEVANEVLPTAKASASFSTVVTDLRAKGYTNGKVKHWVFYDDTGACTCGGTGHIYSDTQPGEANANNGNAGSMFAVTFGYDSTRIMLHELGHNLGAVQNNAPHSTGGFHCTDGLDTMCYNDGASRGGEYRSTHCSVEVFDCGKDDYFHAHPPAGSYLDTHWNLGDRVNRFFLFGHPALTGLSCVAEAEAGSPATCSFVGQDDSAGVRFDIDWGDGSTERVPATGHEPPGVVRSAGHAYAVAGEYEVAVTIVDSDGLVGDTLRAPIRVAADITPPSLTVVDPVVGRAYRGCGAQLDVPFTRAVWVDAGCVRAEATDAVSGVAAIEVRINGVLRATDTEAPYEMEIDLEPGSYGLNAGIEVRAIDGAGNVASFTVRAYLVGS